MRTAGRRWTALLCAAGAAALACDKRVLDSGGGDVAAVVLTPSDSTSLALGRTLQVTAEARDGAGNPINGRTFAWASDDESVATVDDQGLVTAKALGAVSIVASTGGQDGILRIGVVERGVAEVAVTPPSGTVEVGQTLALSATTKDDAGADLPGRAVTWTTSDADIARVDGRGVVTGVAAGGATITATSEGRTGTAVITVTNAAVGSVEISPTSPPEITVGQNTQLTAVVKDASGTPLPDRVVAWTSSNEAAAIVSSTGLVVGIAPGTATITASSGGKSASVSVTVARAPVATVVVRPDRPSVVVGGTIALTAEPRDAAGNELRGRTVTWTSDKPSVATVSSNGTVTGKARGTATITATSEGKRGTATVTVTLLPPRPVATVDVTPSTLGLAVGDRRQLTVTLRDDDGNTLSTSQRAVTWSSSNAAVAEVSSTGLVTARGAGSATVTATSEGKKGEAQVTVSPAPPTPVASVSIEPPAAEMIVGSTRTLVATPRDATGAPLAGRAVTWTTSNGSIASVSSTGVVTAVAEGAATITARASEGEPGTAAITVTPPPVTPVSSVRVTLPRSSMAVGETQTATAESRDGSGNVLPGRAITWQSTDTDVATVDNAGVVTAVAPGTTRIRAISGENSAIRDDATLTVTRVPVASVAVEPSTVSLGVDETRALTAVVRDAAGNELAGRDVDWRSSDTDVATVSGAGIVRGRAPGGPVTITATSEGRSGTATVTVSRAAVARVVVEPSSESISSGSTQEFVARLTDADGNALTGRAVAWSTSDGEVAPITSDGRVTGRKVGTATITATSEGQQGTATLTVTPGRPIRVNKINGSVTDEPRPPGSTLTLTVIAADGNDNPVPGAHIVWTVTDGGGTVAPAEGLTGGDGQMSVSWTTGPTPGARNEVIATVPGAPDSATFVNMATGETGSAESVDRVEVRPGNERIRVGQIGRFFAVARDRRGALVIGRPVLWSSEDERIATIDGDGRARGRDRGETRITANVDGVSGSAKLRVDKADDDDDDDDDDDGGRGDDRAPSTAPTIPASGARA